MATNKLLRVPLRVVFYKESGRWIARCLEFDLIGDGETREQALELLSQAVEIQVETSLEHHNPSNLFHPAPSKYFQMFAAGKDIARGLMELRVQVDNVVIEDAKYREYEEQEFEDADFVPV